jgi:hypothetical protein
MVTKEYQMVDVFKVVSKFNKEVIGIDRPCGTIEDGKEFNFLIGSMKEEIKELITAREESDFIGEIDAICDLVYFAVGGLARMGVSPEASNKIFEVIHDCNMQKSKGKKKEREVTHNLDAVKSSTWIGPESQIMDILDGYHGDKSGYVDRISRILNSGNK